MMQDKDLRKRVLTVLKIVQNAKRDVSTREIAEHLNETIYAQKPAFDRRPIIKDLKAMIEVGFPVKMHRGECDMIYVSWEDE